PFQSTRRCADALFAREPAFGPAMMARYLTLVQASCATHHAPPHSVPHWAMMLRPRRSRAFSRRNITISSLALWATCCISGLSVQNRLHPFVQGCVSVDVAVD